MIVASGAAFEVLAGTNETIGSVEGSGALILGGQRLVSGGNNLTTTFTGLISGTADSQLEKVGGGTFTLTNPNSSFTGGLTVTNGTVSTSFIADAGANSPIGSNGPITLGDATRPGRLVITNIGSNSTNRPIQVSQGGGIIETSNENSEVVIRGAITGMRPLVKLGIGRLTLTGDKMFEGSVVVGDGTLRLDGNIAGTPVIVFNPGELDSSGSTLRMLGPLTLAGGTVSPGSTANVGVFETGSLTFDGGRFVVDLENATALGFDSLNVTGGIEFNGAVDLALRLDFDPEDNLDIFRILLNDGTEPTMLNGSGARFTYNGVTLDDGAHFLVQSNSFSQIFEVRYGLVGDNDVRLIAVPEPNGLLLVALGGFSSLLRRPQRKKSSYLSNRPSWRSNRSAAWLPSR